MERGDENGGRKARWVVAVLLALAICAAPAWLWGQALRSYFLKMDDFVYLAGSRSGQDLKASLLRPHNAHVVPFFRVEMFLLAGLAGTLRDLPAVLGLACYLNLTLATLATGYFLARETGWTAVGLAAMAAAGLSTVLGPAVLWFAAGQALMSGTLVVLMLIALQAWRRGGGWPSLALAGLAGTAAPLCWSGGYAAGPTALAYLWHGEKRTSRRVGLVLLSLSLFLGLAAWTIVGPAAPTRAGVRGGPGQLVTRLPAGLSHIAQAIPEVLILNNLGLDARTAELQGWALCVLLFLGWYYARLRPAGDPPGPAPPEDIRRRRRLMPKLHPLEAAGVTLVLLAFGMTYTARGNYTFENLRALGWYHAIPQLGAVLASAGSWAGRPASLAATRFEPPSVRESSWVVCLAVVLLLLQWPRAHRVLFDYDGAAAPIGGAAAESARRNGPTSPVDLAARARSQRRALAQLDRLEEIARSRGIGRSGLRKVLRRVAVPGMPETVEGLDAFELLRIPEAGTQNDPEIIRAAVAGVLGYRQP
jgi:hypothetical protein